MPTITYLTTIQFDFGAIKLLGDEAAAVGIERPLVVTDKGIVACGILDRVLAHLPGGMTVEIFDETPENPTEAAVLAARDCYIESDCDGLIAVGGGSSMDLAKGAAIMATHAPPLTQYAAIYGGAAKISDKVAPVIAVPTTAGTGSEVGRGAILTLENGRKLGFASPNNIPRRAICDPELTIGLPALLTAATGMDAVAHCVETFISPVVNPPAEGIALEGLRRAMGHIERAVENGEDRVARWEMMMAAMMGAMASLSARVIPFTRTGICTRPSKTSLLRRIPLQICRIPLTGPGATDCRTILFLWLMLLHLLISVGLAVSRGMVLMLVIKAKTGIPVVPMIMGKSFITKVITTGAWQTLSITR